MEEVFILMVIMSACFLNKRMNNKHEIEVIDKFDKWSPKKMKALAEYKRAQCKSKTNNINSFIKCVIKIIL